MVRACAEHPWRTISAWLVVVMLVVVDALLVRLILVPAILHLLGRHAWYIPRWLDRVLPRLTIEPPEAGAATHDAAPSVPAHAPAASGS